MRRCSIEKGDKRDDKGMRNNIDYMKLVGEVVTVAVQIAAGTAVLGAIAGSACVNDDDDGVSFGCPC